MNTYKKFVPNVFIAQCTEKHEKGEKIILTTRHGKENESIVFNFIGFTGTKEAPLYCYSIVRADGFNVQEHAKRKADKLMNASNNAEKKSTEFWKASNKDSDFLRLGEPIKVGHHSERRHRKIIDQAHNNMSKSVEMTDKAQSLEQKAQYWKERESTINLSMPESIDFFTHKLEIAKLKHAGLKSGKYERAHSFSLTYAKKEVNDLEKKVKLAARLWGETPQERLEYIRRELKAERISTGELIELQSLSEFIEPGDVELLEAAGVPEN